MALVLETGYTSINKKGEELCGAVFERADARLAEHFGEETVELLHAGLLLDYWVTPSCKKTSLLEQMFAD